MLLNLTEPKSIKLKEIVYTYIVGQMLMIKERQEIAETFHKLDLNSNGAISIDEIHVLFEKEFGTKMSD